MGLEEVSLTNIFVQMNDVEQVTFEQIAQVIDRVVSTVEEKYE